MVKRVLICGCARSGNSLMLHLMAAGFSNTVIVYDGLGGEQVPTSEELVDGKVVVGKYPWQIERLDVWRADDLGVIFMIRDPRDVLVSKHYKRPDDYWVKPPRWIDAAEAYLANEQELLSVKYEDVLTDPDVVQQRIAQRFDLHTLRSFRDCYEHFVTEDGANISSMRGARPLDPSRIGSWKDCDVDQAYIEGVLRAYPKMRELMARFGYD